MNQSKPEAMMITRAQTTVAVQRTAGRLLHVPDDFPDVQSAIDAASAGDGVFVAPGEYVLSEPLLIHKPLHIIGVDDVGASAVLRFTTREQHVSLLRVTCSNVRLKGVTMEVVRAVDGLGRPPAVPLDPSSPRNVAVSVSANATNVVLDECAVRGVNAHGLFLAEGSYCTLTCCSFESDWGCAVYCGGRLYIDRCDFRDSPAGLVIAQDANVQLKASCVSNCGEGVFVDGWGFVDAAACVFSGCSTGLSFHADMVQPKVSTVRGCEFADCRVCGVVVNGTEVAAMVEKNYFHGSSQCGLLVLNATQRVEVRANAFKQLTGFGVHVFGGSPIVECNAFDGCVGGGVRVDTCRPTLRLNEFVRNRNLAGSRSDKAPPSVAVWINGTSVTRRESHEAYAALQASAFAVKGKLCLTDRANATLAARSVVAAATSSVVSLVRPHPDPHVEGNLFAENDVNVRVTLGCGTFVKNELLSSHQTNVVIEGWVSEEQCPSPKTVTSSLGFVVRREEGAAPIDPSLPEFPCSFANNELRGSVSSHVVLCTAGSFASISHNQISHAPKGFGVLLESCRFVEVKSNDICDCQGGVQARGAGAHGKIVQNNCHGLSLYVQSEAVQSMYTAGNVETSDAAVAEDL